MKLYYNIAKIENKTALLVTEQGYYDANGTPGANGADKVEMFAALERAGARPVTDCAYISESRTLQDVLKSLRSDGHWLSAKPKMNI